MANRTLRVLLKKIYTDGSIDTIYLKSRASDVFLDGSSTDTLESIVTKVNGIQEGATAVSSNATNGYISINGTATQVYAHPNSGVTAGTYNSVTVNAAGHVTAGTSNSYLLSSSKVTFTTASTKANIVSNSDTIAVMLGKLAKWYSSFGSLAWLSSVGTSQLDTTLSTAYNQRVVTGTANTTASVTESREITAAGYVADARAVANLQTQINTINSSLNSHLKVVDDSIDFGCVPPLSAATGSGTPKARRYLRGDNTWQLLYRLFSEDANGDVMYTATLQADGNLVVRSAVDNSVKWYSDRIPAGNGNDKYYLNGTHQWSQIPTFVGATTAADGLMTAADKIKLNKTALVSQLGASAISKNGTYISAVGAATIQVYRIGGDSGILCFTANGINVTTAAGNGAHIFSLALTDGGGKVAGDWYFKPMNNSGTFSNTGAFVASAGNSTATVLKVYAYGTIAVGAYSVSTVIPIYFT